MQTFDLQEAAAFLKMSAEAVRRKAKAGNIPASKPGKQWVFLQDDLVDYLRSRYRETRAPQVSCEGEKTWRCGNEKIAKTGGLISEHQMDSEYGDLLWDCQPTSRERVPRPIKRRTLASTSFGRQTATDLEGSRRSLG